MADLKSILIVGASRGLGKGLAELYAKSGWSVLATVRDAKAAALGGVETATVDINDDVAVKALHEKTAGKAFDVIFVVAGVGSSYAPIHETEPDLALDIYRTNAVSPIRFAEAFTDRLAQNGQMVFMTSVMGSIAENETGGVDAYRASKAALNMLTKSFALRHKGITVTLMHPGWVKTDMGGASAQIDVPTSTAGIRKVVDQRTGKGDLAFVDYTGRAIPW